MSLMVNHKLTAVFISQSIKNGAAPYALQLT